MRHLLTISDLSRAEIERIFAITKDLKARFESGLREPLLPGRVMALLFEHPSLRTRVSFEAAMCHLGGNSLFLGGDVGWGSRESIADFGRVLSQYVDVIVVRAKGHAHVEELARYSASCSVVNGLTDFEHPCQALADLYTLRELTGGNLPDATLAYVGDCNNVARSLAEGCAKLGVRMNIASPEGYRFDERFIESLHQRSPQAEVKLINDPAEAVREATAVYTDVWASMGQEAESAKRRAVFAPYQVNAELIAKAPQDCYFMHCLPAHRGEEVTDDVIDSPRSVVVQEAGNRMHVQKGVLAWLLGAKG